MDTSGVVGAMIIDSDGLCLACKFFIYLIVFKRPAAAYISSKSNPSIVAVYLTYSVASITPRHYMCNKTCE